MKKLYTLIIPILAVMFVVLMAGFSGSDLKSSGGAPAGYTNSPADGKDCSHCMGGTAVPVTGWITSDIPVTGYVPGNTYTITVTATGTGRKGFQVSPQDDAGNLVGSLTPGTGNKIVGTKYVTHSSAPTGDPTAWNFQWTAPAAGAGAVVFYGSVAVGKPNTKTTTMTVLQSTVGMGELSPTQVSVFPNPARERVTVSFKANGTQEARIDLLNSSGELVSTLLDPVKVAGEFTRSFGLPGENGLYFVRLTLDGNSAAAKLYVLN